MAHEASCRDTRGFTILEVQIASLVLILTVLGIFKLVHSHQQLVGSMEDWLQQPVQYVIPPSAPFEDLLGVPATLSPTASAPVHVDTRGALAYAVTIQEVVRNLDPPEASATVVLQRTD